MRAYSIESFGLDKLAVITRPSAPLGPHAVRVRVRAVSLNYRDMMTVEGTYNPRQKLPLVPCSDAAGEVVEVGSAVTRFAVGARVMTLFAQRWQAGRPTMDKLKSTLGGPADGVLAEEIVLSEEGLVAVPEALSFADASTLPCAGLTAWSALEQAGVTSGDTVVVQGTGGVSIFALQLAKLRGARVVVTSKSDEKLERARALGAHETIDHANEDIAARVREITKRRGVEVVAEHVGGRVFEAGVASLARDGRLVTCGATIGHQVGLDLNVLFGKHLTLLGSWMGRRRDMADVLAHLASGALTPSVDAVMPLADGRKAHERIEAREHFGKIVLVP